MAAAELTRTEQERIDRWRAEELERAGYETTAASLLAAALTSICTTRSTYCGTVAPRSSRSRSCSRARAPSASLGRMRSALTFVASIPSPSSGTIDLGPLTIHMYGLMLLAGIAACIAITGHRWVARGGDWDLIFRVAVWGVGAGIVGARLYHLATSWNEVPDEWWGPFAVWEGGLGIWGGIAGGILVGGIHRPPVRRERHRAARRRGAGAPRRAGDRTRRQLVEPGALRQADQPAVGARDRRRTAGPTSTSSTRRSTRRSSTRRSGTSLPPGCC